MIPKNVIDLVSHCASYGINRAVISPGSRSGSITICMDHHPDIEVLMVPDERSAGFIALGMAQKSKTPVALVCTSGTAVLNYGPAIAEAYYQEVPLVVVSADRPPEWIDKYDGQTIRQNGVFELHTKAYFNLPADQNKEELERSSNQVTNALKTVIKKPIGPVHINVPIREPFYPKKGEIPDFKLETTHIDIPTTSLVKEEIDKLSSIWNSTQKRVLVLGQLDFDKDLTERINAFSAATNTPIIADVTSNVFTGRNLITKQDAFLHPSNWDQLTKLQPELIVSFGNSLISKNLKLFLRKHKASHHWHIKDTDRENDSLLQLTESVKIEPLDFLSEFLTFQPTTGDIHYLNDWQRAENLSLELFENFLGNSSSEFKAYATVLNSIPENSVLQVANSMAIRYVNFCGLKDKNLKLYCNRGTSGIDGSNGTSVGYALETEDIVTLLTGDLAFLYDPNAFWHNGEFSNLRIVIFNNSGGEIFRMIPGPSEQKNYKDIFETSHTRNASNIAKEFGFGYQKASSISELNAALEEFYEASGKPKIIEFHSDPNINEEEFFKFKAAFSELEES